MTPTVLWPRIYPEKPPSPLKHRHFHWNVTCAQVPPSSPAIKSRHRAPPQCHRYSLRKRAWGVCHVFLPFPDNWIRCHSRLRKTKNIPTVILRSCKGHISLPVISVIMKSLQSGGNNTLILRIVQKSGAIISR